VFAGQFVQADVPDTWLYASAGQTVQPVLFAAQVPPNPAEHMQPACPVVPSVIDPALHAVQGPDPAAVLKLLTPHAVQPVLAVVHVPPNPAEHTQPVWPVAPSVVDPVTQVVHVPDPTAALKLLEPHAM
jgi:hypothetical protein